jgi:hypothetical protein
MHSAFAVHMLNEKGRLKATRIALAFEGLLTSLEEVVEGEISREMSICRTKLEEACFFAKKAMAMQEANQEPPT